MKLQQAADYPSLALKQLAWLRLEIATSWKKNVNVKSSLSNPYRSVEMTSCVGLCATLFRGGVQWLETFRKSLLPAKKQSRP